jgi:transposase
MLKETFRIDVIGATVNAHLKRLGLTYQKPHYRASEQDPVEVEHFLHDKFIRIQRLAKKIGAEIAFEDEAGVHLNEHSGRTWGISGETPEIVATDKRDKFNLLSTVTNEGNLRFSIKKDNINSDRYVDFLKQLLKGRTRPLILMVDHAPFHHSKKVRDFVHAHRQKIRVYFLPRYAPKYNPDEQVWNEIKHKKIGRQAVKNKSDLKRRLVSSLRSLQKNVERIKSFFLLPDTKYASCSVSGCHI